MNENVSMYSNRHLLITLFKKLQVFLTILSGYVKCVAIPICIDRCIFVIVIKQSNNSCFNLVIYLPNLDSTCMLCNIGNK